MKPPKGKVFIYGLRHPETKEVRYIGKTKTDIRHRLNAHLCEKGDTRKVRWVATLRWQGLVPEPFILEEVDEEKWEERECYWIAYYRELGCDLTNLTDGGDGVHNPAQETRNRLSFAQKQLYADPDFKARMLEVTSNPNRCAKISQALHNKPKPYVRNLPQNQPGRKLTEEHRRKISEGEKGKKCPGQKVPPQALEAAKIANVGNQYTKGRVMPQQERLQRSLANKGQKRSEETKEKQRLARSKFWERKRQENPESMVAHRKACSDGQKKRYERVRQKKEQNNGITLQGLWDSFPDDTAV